MSGPPTARRPWSGQSRGGRLGHLFFVAALRLVGPRVAGLFLYPVVAYFLVAVRGRLRAARPVLEACAGPASWWGWRRREYRLLLTFARCMLDRALAHLVGRERFVLRSQGREHLSAPLAAGSGVVLLSAHMGNYEVAGLLSGRETPLLEGLHVVMLDAEREAIKRVFERMGSVHRLPRIIAVNRAEYPALRILEALRAGAPVAMHGDRILDARPGGWVWCDFLGGRAPFPTGPFLLAAAARVPVVLTFAFNVGPQRYELWAEPPRHVVLPRGEREAALAREAQWYADRLAHWVKRYPDNWFNFYDFFAAPVPPTATENDRA